MIAVKEKIALVTGGIGTAICQRLTDLSAGPRSGASFTYRRQ